MEARSEASSGFPYKLTEEDRVKGRSKVTDRRRTANALNAVKHGKYAVTLDEFVNCNSCKHRWACPFYERDSSCKIINLDSLKQLTKIHSAQPDELLQIITKGIVEHELAVKKSPTIKNIQDAVKLKMEFFKMKFGEKVMSLTLS